MYTSDYILKRLAEERVADLRQDAAARRTGLHDSERTLSREKAREPVRVPVQIIRRQRPRLPIIARGVAGFDDYRSEGRRS